jgi:hypothetical protein
MRTNAVRRCDRRLDALWAPFVGTVKILASFFQNTAQGGAMTVVRPPTGRRGAHERETDDHRSR